MKKKNLPIIIALIILIISICSGITHAVIATNNSTESKVESSEESVFYPLTTVVNEIIEEANLVIVVDHEGNLWEFYGVEDWKEGDIATLLMDACDVFNDYDDEIVEIRYGGNVKGFE